MFYLYAGKLFVRTKLKSNKHLLCLFLVCDKHFSPDKYKQCKTDFEEEQFILLA